MLRCSHKQQLLSKIHPRSQKNIGNLQVSAAQLVFIPSSAYNGEIVLDKSNIRHAHNHDLLRYDATAVAM